MYTVLFGPVGLDTDSDTGDSSPSHCFPGRFATRPSNYSDSDTNPSIPSLVGPVGQDSDTDNEPDQDSESCTAKPQETS